MAAVIATVYAGLLNLDLSELLGWLFDLPPGAMAHLRPEGEGIDGVEHELDTNMPTIGLAAGVSQEAYSRFKEKTLRLGKIRAHRVVVAKLLEVLVESEAKYVHDRENDLAVLVDSIRSIAKRTGDKGLLAAFERTIKYIGQVAEKGLKTRQKNAEAKAEAEKAQTQTSPAAPGTTPSQGGSTP